VVGGVEGNFSVSFDPKPMFTFWIWTWTKLNNLIKLGYPERCQNHCFYF
jgi:hypothetical protein